MSSNRTNNLLQYYMETAGHSEVPRSYHRWTCLTLVASMVADRVWYQKTSWERVVPNLYTFLVGKSGAEKAGAIRFGMQFKHPEMGIAYGPLTRGDIIYGDRPPKDGNLPPFFLVQEDVAQSIGAGVHADNFVKLMTSLYNMPSATELGDGIYSRCANWLGGVTTNWLRNSINQHAAISGFFNQGCLVEGWHVYHKRTATPDIPKDFESRVQVLRDRFEDLPFVTGAFEMDEEAAAAYKHWYEGRREPRGGAVEFWAREPDLVIKLSMLLSLCERLDRVIAGPHFRKAFALVKELRESFPIVLGTTEEPTMVAKHLGRVRNKIYRHRDGVDRSDLLRFVCKYGVRAEHLDQIIAQLRREKDIQIVKRGKGTKKVKTVYKPMAKVEFEWGNNEGIKEADVG